MATRIRYHKKDMALYTDVILCGTSLYHIVILTDTLELMVKNEDNYNTVILKAKSLGDLKRKAKNELRKLGAKFNDEVRNRGATEKLDCDKLSD